VEVDLDHYTNREHAKAKHDLLENYIQRYAMILGQHASEIAFVDAFAGPWQSGATDRSDTSFGLSTAALKRCAETLYARFSRRPVIKALWIEEDAAAYSQLSAFAECASSSRIQVRTAHASFQDSIDQIVQFLGSDAYGFIFVDPKGYKNLIEPQVLAPLLKLPKAELLINYMWDHIKFAFGRSDEAGHRSNLERLYGPELPRLLRISDPAVLADEALRVYENALRVAASREDIPRLRVLSYPILDTHGNRYPKYWLVHATHAATGLTTFADECDKMHRTQDAIFYIANANRREHRTGTADLFRGHVETLPSDSRSPHAETGGWLALIPTAGSTATIDTDTWADLLERGRCLPGDLQIGFKKLCDEGLVANCDAKGKRRSRFVHFEDGERIRRLK
jgi:three-Cys-motif partner protein